jgi:hypothetical protein
MTMFRWLTVAVIYLTATGASPFEQTGTDDSSYRHGYYLFLVGAPRGCEDCYIPLLVTKSSLEELKSDRAIEDSVLITTYERDSIWHYDGVLQVTQSDIDTAERKVRAQNRLYRYQEIGSREILKLLENPLGKIPISRIVVPSKLPAGPQIKDLVADFRLVR